MSGKNNLLTCFLRSEDAAWFDGIEADVEPKCRSLAATLGGVYHQAESNLRNDTELSVEHKFGLAMVLADSTSLEAEVLKKEAVNHCRSHQRLGSVAADCHQRKFGHVMLRRRLVERLASVDDPTQPHTFTNRSPDPAVDVLLAADLSRQRFELQDITLSAYQMWSFYQEATPQDTYEGVDCRGVELRRRLGLGFYPDNEEFLYCGLDLSAGPSAHTPTTFDSDLNPYFRPGGRTFPLDGAGDGLPEAVHEPVSGERLSQPIRPAATT